MGQIKNLSSDRNRTHDLPNTGWSLYPLSYKNNALAILINLPFKLIYVICKGIYPSPQMKKRTKGSTKSSMTISIITLYFTALHLNVPLKVFHSYYVKTNALGNQQCTYCFVLYIITYIISWKQKDTSLQHSTSSITAGQPLTEEYHSVSGFTLMLFIFIDFLRGFQFKWKISQHE